MFQPLFPRFAPAPGSLRFGEWAIRSINEVYLDDDEGRLTTLIRQHATPGRQWFLVERSGASPGFAVCDVDGVTVVLLEGTTNRDQSIAQFVDWSTDFTEVPLGAVPTVTRRIAKSTARIAFNLVPPDKGKAVFCGHSFGGTLALVAAAYVVKRFPPLQAASVSFGAPKAGPDEFATFCNRNVLHTRYVNRSDLITTLPPTRQEAPLAYTIIPMLLGALYSQFSHTLSGVLLFEGGAQPSPSPAHPQGVIPEIDFIAWAQSNSGGVGPEHLPLTYARRIAAEAFLREPIPVTTPAPLGFIGQVRELVKRTAEPLIVPEEPTMPVIPKIAEPDPFQLPGSPAARVAWLGRIVASFSSRTKAASFARALRKSLAKLVQSDGVYPGAFTQSTADFLAQAAAGGQGWDRPVVVLN